MPTASSTSLAYCQYKLNGDLTYYYMLLFVSRAARSALMALYAFWEEIREIPRECSDAEVARTKLAWWHEEIHRLYAGQPRHPVATALRAAVAEHQLPATTFLGVIETVAQHALDGGYPTYDALVRYSTNARGNIELLGSRIAGKEVPTAASIGARFELVRLLRDVRSDAYRGWVNLPNDDMARFGVTSADLAVRHATSAAISLIRFHAQRLQNDLATELKRIAPRERTSMVQTLTAAEIAAALLKPLVANPQILFDTRPSLSPLRQLWIAWRVARHATQAS